jgi:hypothetical protein
MRIRILTKSVWSRSTWIAEADTGLERNSPPA